MSQKIKMEMVMDINKKKSYNIILCLLKKNLPDEIIHMLFCEWKVEKNYWVCANIYCSGFIIGKEENIIINKNRIYSICNNICDIHYTIQYLLENDVYYQERSFLNDYIYNSICCLENEDKNKFYEIYPYYFDEIIY